MDPETTGEKCVHPNEEQKIYIYEGVIRCGKCGVVTGRAGFYDPLGYDEEPK